MSDPADLTIKAAGEAMRTGELTSVDLTEAVLERARITESQLHAFLTLDQAGAKAGAVAAQRAADIVTRTGQPHVYVPLTSGRLPRSESCPVMENDEDNSKWQMISPELQSSCEVFGQNDAFWLRSWADDMQKDDSESYVWLLWRKYSCCTSTRGALLFTTGGAVCG